MSEQSIRKQHILITGASGLIGSRLSDLLSGRGHEVSHLGRTVHQGKYASFTWDVKHQTMDVRALENIDTIIHLAGAGIADKQWTTNRKLEILESRTQSTRLLATKLRETGATVKNFISASAIGYYGFDDNHTVFTEASPAGRDFLSRVVQAWEAEADQIGKQEKRLVKIRIGIVLSEKGGALEAMAKPVKLYVGAPLGSGDQYVSWIHIDDLCGIFIRAVEDPMMQGVYNATAPSPVTNKELTKIIGKVLHRPVIFPAVPGIVLKVMLGEMAETVLKGNQVSSKKIQDEGYVFQYMQIEEAVKSLLHN
jgi:uncharacterized protein (TIGR01777 family)